MEPYKWDLATLKEFVDVAGMHMKDGVKLGYFDGAVVGVQQSRSPHCRKNAFQMNASDGKCS